MRRIVVLELVSLCAVLAVAVVGAGSALAASELPVLGSFGEEGQGAGQFVIPRGVAVDDSAGSSAGDVYVVDQNNHRVEKFDAVGDFIWAAGLEVNATKVKEAEEGKSVSKVEEDLCTAASENTCKSSVVPTGPYPVGALVGVEGIAVDPSSGDVYVQDWKLSRVEKFGSDGELLLTFGGHVNETKVKEKEGGNSAITESEEDVCTVASGNTCTKGIGGSEHGELESWSAGDEIAVGATGTVFVARKDSVQEFEADGVWKGEVSLEALSATGHLTALAIDPSTEDLYLKDSAAEGVREFELKSDSYSESSTTYDSDSSAVKAVAVEPGSGEVFVVDAGSGVHVQRYESSGALSAESTEGLLAASTGLGVSKSGTVYAADSANESTANKVLVFGHPPTTGLPAPSVSSLPLAQDGSMSAQAQASINPHFTKAVYYVEYGIKASYGKRAPAASGVFYVPAETNTAQTVGVALEGLEPGTEYHYRFVAENAAHEITYGPDEVFVTDAEGITGLPDGRVYEQVSPPFKNGNFFDAVTGFVMGLAEADGDAVLYPMSGAVGSSDAGVIGEYVSRHLSSGGWVTTQVTPRPSTEISTKTAPAFILPSASFTGFLFGDEEPFAAGDAAGFANIFTDESVEGGLPSAAQWVTRPQIPNPKPEPGVGVGASIGYEQDYVVTGASPTLSRVYFTYAGTLLPEDAERAAHVGTGLSDGKGVNLSEVDPWGFYEWSEGVLYEAGTLPDGKLSPFGAIPAMLGFTETNLSRAESYQAGEFDNAVSEDGSRAFFVSPDPLASTVTDPNGCAVQPANCTSEAPELYVRESQGAGAAKVALISQSHVPLDEGAPAAHGVTAVKGQTYDGGGGHGGATYAFASSDGSHVFFASVDRLTASAPENDALKEYDYDLTTGILTYVPEVEGAIVAVSRDGEAAMFVDTHEAPWAQDGQPRQLKVWRENSGNPTVTLVASLPDALLTSSATNAIIEELSPRVRSAHISSDGEVFVFSTDAPIAGFNDLGVSTTHTALNGVTNDLSALEVYRFDIGSDELDCVSCAPQGVKTVGDANMSYNNFSGLEEVSHLNGSSAGYAPQTTQETRGMSANGERIFFDTQTPLVPQAVNGERDVYEWENGHVYLISSGSASENSYYLDNSESGDDVFFATSAGLVPGDTDEAYDIYDARVPRPGDTATPEVPPCKGSVCQGPPSTPSLLGAPPSETFSGQGNPTLAPEIKPAVTAKPKAKAKTKKKKKKEKGRGEGESRHRAQGSSRHGKGKTTSGRRGK